MIPEDDQARLAAIAPQGWQQRACEAIEQAITDDQGLDGLEGEALLREVGYWPRKATDAIPTADAPANPPTPSR